MKIKQIIAVTILLTGLSLGYIALASRNHSQPSVAGVASCNANTDIAGRLFFDANSNGLKDEAIYTGTDGNVSSSIGGSGQSNSGNGIDERSYPPLPVGGNKLTNPEAIWSRSSHGGNPNGSIKTQPTDDLSSVKIQIFDSNNQLAADFSLDASGRWIYQNATQALPLRVEYTNLPHGFEFTSAANGGALQKHIISNPGCDYDVGYFYPSRYCQTNPTVFMACNFRSGSSGVHSLQSVHYRAGEILNDSNSDSVVDDLDSSHSSPNLSKSPVTTTKHITLANTGPVFGLAHHRQSEQIFMSAATVGSGGFQTGQPREVSSYGPIGAGGVYKVNTQTNPYSVSGFYNVSGVSGGTTYPDSIGTTGLGGMDTSDDGRDLFIVNASAKDLVKLALNNSTNSNVSVAAQSNINIPNPGCNANVSDQHLPYGLRVWRGSVFVGTVCSHQEKGFIQKFNGNSWSIEATTSKANASRIGGQPVEGGIYTDLGYYAPYLITGLDFDSDGSIIFGTNAGPGHTDFAQGEIYIIENSQNGYKGAKVMQPANQDFANSVGGIAVFPGTGQVVAAVQSPTVDKSNGLAWYNTSSRRVSRKYTVYRTDVSPYDGTLASSNGIGEIETVCSDAPLQLGGRVWLEDKNANGIQDPNEPGIEGVTVNLYNQSDQLLGSTTTNNNGRWFFGGLNALNLDSGAFLEPNTNYIIKLDNQEDYTSGGPLFDRSLSLKNAAGSSTLSDSQADLVDNIAQTTYTTEGSGDNESNIDVGFVLPATDIIEPSEQTDLPEVANPADGSSDDNFEPSSYVDEFLRVEEQNQSLLERTADFIRRNVPESVAKSFPYFLLILLVVWLVLLMYQTYDEVQNSRRMEKLIKKIKQIAKEKDNFISLAAHYLRTPLAIISGGLEIIPKTDYSAKASETINSITAELEAIMSEAQSINKPQVSMQQAKSIDLPTYKRPTFYVPIIAAAIVIVLGNFLFGVVAGMSLGTINLITQLIGFAIVATMAYAVVRKRHSVNERKIQLDSALKFQQDLDIARNKLIVDAGKQLSAYIRKLINIRHSLNKSDKSFQMISDGIMQFEEVIDKFALVASLKFNDLETSPANVDVDQLLSKFSARKKAELKAKNVTLDYTGSFDKQFYVDSDLLSIVTDVVLDNAAEFSPEGGKITIKRDGHGFSVTNSGDKLSKDQISHMFEPFYKTDAATEFNHEGIGLSLYISKLIMNYLGGYIDVRTGANGTTFRIQVIEDRK